MTITLVSTVTVGSGGAASIDFTSIPQTGTDLLLSFSLREGVSTTGRVFCQLNGTATGTSVRYLRGDGASANSSTDTYVLGEVPATGATASTFGNGQIYLPNYAGSSNKTGSVDLVTENNATTAHQRFVAYLKTNTAAITSIQLQPWDTFAQYSTASLYTITKGSGGATVS